MLYYEFPPLNQFLMIQTSIQTNKIQSRVRLLQDEGARDKIREAIGGQMRKISTQIYKQFTKRKRQKFLQLSNPTRLSLYKISQQELDKSVKELSERMKCRTFESKIINPILDNLQEERVKKSEEYGKEIKIREIVEYFQKKKRGIEVENIRIQEAQRRRANQEQKMEKNPQIIEKQIIQAIPHQHQAQEEKIMASNMLDAIKNEEKQKIELKEQKQQIPRALFPSQQAQKQAKNDPSHLFKFPPQHKEVIQLAQTKLQTPTLNIIAFKPSLTKTQKIQSLLPSQLTEIIQSEDNVSAQSPPNNPFGNLFKPKPNQQNVKLSRLANSQTQSTPQNPQQPKIEFGSNPAFPFNKQKWNQNSKFNLPTQNINTQPPTQDSKGNLFSKGSSCNLFSAVNSSNLFTTGNKGNLPVTGNTGSLFATGSTSNLFTTGNADASIPFPIGNSSNLSASGNTDNNTNSNLNLNNRGSLFISESPSSSFFNTSSQSSVFGKQKYSVTPGVGNKKKKEKQSKRIQPQDSVINSMNSSKNF